MTYRHYKQEFINSLCKIISCFPNFLTTFECLSDIFDMKLFYKQCCKLEKNIFSLGVSSSVDTLNIIIY